ncbi:MAG: type II secretion system protein GspD [Spartobacteria bacterium]|nr:type II secretion system protein GspD [Spartobacteria bacterium]
MQKRWNNWIARLPALLVCLALCLPTGGWAQESNGTTYVNFSFDRVDIQMLVKLVGEMTGKQFVIDDKIEGRVTIVTPPQIPLENVYPLFLSILESSGYSIVLDGPVHHVVALDEAGITTGPVVAEGQTEPDDMGIVTKVIRLKHIEAVELIKILEPMVRGGKKGALTAFGATNHLILTETSEAIARIEAIIGELDRPGSARTVDVVQLKNAAAEDIARQIMTAMLGSEKAGERLSRHVQQIAEGRASLPTGALVVPAAHANSLVLVGTPVQIDELKEIITMLDTEGLSGRGPLNAIFLKYLGAEEAAKNLKALLEKTTEADPKSRIAIEANLSNNALIIHASPRDFEWVRQLVEQLDQVPQQVLVEILIAEVSLGADMDLGVEWGTTDQPKNGRETFIGHSRPGEENTVADYVKNGFFPQGLTLGVAKGTYLNAAGIEVPLVPFLLRAKAKDNDVKILSSIPLWAQNNTEATVSVVKNIPMLKSTIDKGSGTASDTIQTIERKDVGIKLTLTPHVNPDREIMLDLNPSIEAIVDEGEPGQYTPTFAKREVKTTVTVPDRSTIVISGLIQEEFIQTISKIPLLGDIPFLGWLFRWNSKKTERTNLMIFVTPIIVTDMNEAMAIKREWEDRTALGTVATNVSVHTAIGE